MGDGHTEGDQKGKFCSLRADGKCPCGNKYTTPCKATMAAWEAESAGSSRFLQKYGDDGFQPSSANAHHIACVASVTKHVTANTEIGSIVRTTKWCVNDKFNMIALPLWPHTLQWYIKFNKKSYLFWTDLDAPPFKNLPQHDYDHDRYIDEVSFDLEELVSKVKAKKKKHKEAKATLTSGLNGIVTKHRGHLDKGRATHKKWFDGFSDKDKNWYKAFSMSKDNPSFRAFPADGNTLDTKIKETQRLINLGR